MEGSIAAAGCMAWAPRRPGHVCEGSVGRLPSEAPTPQPQPDGGSPFQLRAVPLGVGLRAAGCGGAGEQCESCFILAAVVDPTPVYAGVHSDIPIVAAIFPPL